MKRYFLGLFLLFSLAEIVALFVEIPIVHASAKPLIVLSLIGYYYASVPHRSSVFVFALVFCWIGDVLLLKEGELFFMGGLGAFLIGHLLYIMAYKQHQELNEKNELLPTQKIRFSFPIILTGTGLIVILFPKLGGLKIPVLIYAVVLIIMVMTALFRFGRTISKSFWMVMTGAALFMASDSILAINKFYAPIPMGGVWVMITYISAQYLIVEGIIADNRQ